MMNASMMCPDIPIMSSNTGPADRAPILQILRDSNANATLHSSEITGRME